MNYWRILLLISLFPLSGFAQEGDFSFFNCQGQLEIKETDGGKYSRILVGQKLLLLDRHLDTIQTLETDKYGKFIFKKLKSGQGFLLLLEPSNDIKHVTKIAFTYNYGLATKMLKVGPDGSFKIEIVRNEYSDVSDKSILQALQDAQKKAAMKIQGRLFLGIHNEKVPLAEQDVHLKNEKGKVIQTSRTSKEGDFSFKDVPKDEKVNIFLDEKTKVPDGATVYMAQNNGSIVREFLKDKNGFHFEILPSDFAVLEVDETVAEPQLNTGVMVSVGKRAEKEPVIIPEPIFYTEGAYEVSRELAEKLDKVALILKTEPQLTLEIRSHTDSKGNEKANQELSEKRATSAAAYLVLERGIAPSRVKGIGFGESQLVQPCKDPAHCTEEENARNRRTEFVFTKKS